MRVLLAFGALFLVAPLTTVQALTPGGGGTRNEVHHGYDRTDRRVHHGLPPGYAAYGYAGYVDHSDFDGNRSFDPDKWNDWWHERPERAFPRWMSRNQDCARPWYSGSVLTC